MILHVHLHLLGLVLDFSGLHDAPHAEMRLMDCRGAALILPAECGKAKQATPLPISQSGATSSSVVHFTQPGVFYVACSVGMHCSAGQHQQITVK